MGRSNKRIHRVRGYHPRSNFPVKSGHKRSEQLLVIAFARSYAASIGTSELKLLRELPTNGYGIPDLVCLRSYVQSATQTRSGTVRKYIVAFEMKMEDWRRAIAQAFRYTYFAHQSIVVLPDSKSQSARSHLQTFKKLGIGLWEFEKKSGSLKKTYTPPYRKPKHKQAFLRALASVEETS